MGFAGERNMLTVIELDPLAKNVHAGEEAQTQGRDANRQGDGADDDDFLPAVRRVVDSALLAGGRLRCVATGHGGAAAEACDERGQEQSIGGRLISVCGKVASRIDAYKTW